MAGAKKKNKTLKVRTGIEPPESINPEALNKIRQHRKPLLDASRYVEGIIKGDRSLLSQAITIIESASPQHQELAQGIIRGSLPHAGESVRIGITGVPGVGKSTFIESLGTQITASGKKLAVLAIDPSSERSGGSILGDKTRMEELSTQDHAYIRPSPTGGSLGGVARKTRETIILCEAAGYEVIFIETVGVGQSETTVHSMVDFFLLLMLAGAGDELQGIKRGIMEMADLVAITKADGNNRDKAERARMEYANALHLLPPSESGWTPQVLTCSSHEQTGIREIWKAAEGYVSLTRRNGYFEWKRNQQARYWMYEFIHESLQSHFYAHPLVGPKLEQLERKVLEGSISSFHAAMEILKEYFPD
jgi:LAO/AO transport system kinase